MNRITTTIIVIIYINWSDFNIFDNRIVFCNPRVDNSINFFRIN